MKKDEFRKWCDDYAIFHYINTLGKKDFAFNIKERFVRDNHFLTNNLEEFKVTGKIDDYFYEKNGEWAVFIHED